MNIELQQTILVRGRPRWTMDVHPEPPDGEPFAVVRPRYDDADKWKSFSIYLFSPEQAADLGNAILQAGQMLADTGSPDDIVPIGAESEAPATTPLTPSDLVLVDSVASL